MEQNESLILLDFVRCHKFFVKFHPFLLNTKKYYPVLQKTRFCNLAKVCAKSLLNMSWLVEKEAF